MKVVPDVKTLAVLPWVQDEHNNCVLEEVICDCYFSNDLPIEFSARQMAKMQLKRLEDKGLYLLSSFEFEFRLLKLNSNDKEWALGIDYCSSTLLQMIEPYLIKLSSCLKSLGITVETMHTELGSGMIEVTLIPLRGIEAADAAFRFKRVAHEIALKFGMKTCFMAKPILDETGNGLHFNHSLWRIENDNNFFYDSRELSSDVKNWISGMLNYGKSAQSLYCPTMNCYRRLHHAWAPEKLDWGIEKRTTSVRVKLGDQSGTYVENRIPSSNANPYLIMAGNIASGLLGMTEELEVPQYGEGVGMLATTLEEAIHELKSNTEFKKVLGTEFVDIFCGTKLKDEVQFLTKKFAECSGPEEQLEIEKKLYMDIM